MTFPSEYINILNFAIIAIIALCAYTGYRSGLLLKLLGCVSLVISCILAYFIAGPIADMIQIYPKEFNPLKDSALESVFYDTLNEILIFFIIVIVINLVLSVLKSLFKFVDRIPLANEVNKAFGLIFGFVQGILIVCLISIVFATPLFNNGKLIIEDSLLKPAYDTTKGLLVVASDPLEFYEIIQKLTTPSQELLEEDITIIKEWLTNYGLNENEINQYLDSLLKQARYV